MNILFSKREKGLEIWPMPNPEAHIGVCYLSTCEGWYISKRGPGNQKRWEKIHVRHVPKKYRASALIMG